MVDGKTEPIVLRDVIFAPEMKVNLISKSRVRRAGFAIFAENDENHTLQGVSRFLHKQSGKTVLNLEESPEDLDVAGLAVVRTNTEERSFLELWHRQLYHVSKPA